MKSIAESIQETKSNSTERSYLVETYASEIMELHNLDTDNYYNDIAAIKLKLIQKKTIGELEYCIIELHDVCDEYYEEV